MKRLIESLASFQNSEQEWFVGFWPVDSQLKSKGFSFDLLSHVCFWSEYTVAVIHIIKLQKFLDQHDELLSIWLIMQSLTLYVLPVEGRNLTLWIEILFFRYQVNRRLWRHSSGFEHECWTKYHLLIKSEWRGFSVRSVITCLEMFKLFKLFMKVIIIWFTVSW